MDKYLGVLYDHGGYYQCPKTPGGKRLGPLVGYTGTYEDKAGEHKNFVGEKYYNFAVIENRPEILSDIANELAVKVADSPIPQLIPRGTTLPLPTLYFLGAPMGGISLAYAMALWLCQPVGLLGVVTRFAFAEKKITELATAISREKSKLVLNRHELVPGSYVVVVEDVCNNFSTTEQIEQLVEAADSHFAGIACFLNRSPSTTWHDTPVISLVHIPTQQWQQDDPAVAEDITSGNVVWKPKQEWPRLMAAGL